MSKIPCPMTNTHKSSMIKYDSNLGFYLWGKKDVMLSHIKKISEKIMGLFTGRLRISGSNNFRDWFHFDAARPTKKKAIMLETNFKIYKRLCVTPEKHGTAFNILKKLV